MDARLGRCRARLLPILASAVLGACAPVGFESPEASSGSCSVTGVHEVPAVDVPLIGDGPIYLAGRGVFDLEGSAPGSDGRFAIKTIWVGSDDYAGQVALRGRRLDASGDVRFSTTDGEALSVSLPNGRENSTWLPDGWSDFTASLRVADVGCYELEATGETFTSAITVEVRQ